MPFERPPRYTAVDLLLCLFGRYQRFRIIGPSMHPTLKEGEEVIVDLHAYDNTSPQVGDIILAHHPHQKELKTVKRVTAVTPHNTLLLAGDNHAESTDSRSYGDVQFDHVIGRVRSLFI